MATGKKARVANQPDGMPQGRHLTGFKGTKVEGVCLCGGCHPKAQAGKKFVKVIDPNKQRTKTLA